MPRKFNDITGQSFGRLTVVKCVGLIKNGKWRVSGWECVCECGNKLVTTFGNLKQYKSCGCYHREIVKKIKVDYSGKFFGMLKVIRFDKMVDGNSYWLCECECGKENVISASALRAGQKSCGCKQGWFRAEIPGLWKDKAKYSKWQRTTDPSKRMRNSVSGSIRRMLTYQGSYKRKKSIANYLPYTIDELKAHLESLWEPWMNWGNYGGKADDARMTWHIDHIKPHSLFEYTSMSDPQFLECWSLSNLRPLEKKANMSKGDKFDPRSS